MPTTLLSAPAGHLAQLVQSFVDSDEIIGAELLVIHNRKTVLHRAFGYADREEKKPLKAGSYFAVRSMTKPFTGMAAQILIDDGKLELDAPVARYLPSFDNEKSRRITIRQLLTHRGGFAFVMPLEKPLSAFSGGLRELADLAGARGPDREPGLRFEYSDVGSDVLGAVVSAVSGVPLETFILERILRPLQLMDTFPEMEAVSEARRERVVVRYFGIAGNWTRYWGATDAPIYPFLKGSGGLFSTARDYARFLQVWMDRETGAGGALLSAEAFSRALVGTVGQEAVSTGFPDVTADYGQMWTLYRRNAEPAELLAFGHGGSDGTHAYAFPKEKLLVCFLTQTRGNHTTGRFEAALSHLFLKPDDAAFTRLLTPSTLSANSIHEYTGLYAKDDRVGSLAAVIEMDGALAFEIPGRMLLRLKPTEDGDRWVPERLPNDSVTFRRENGRVVGLAVSRGGKVDEAVRFTPDPSLPTVDELLALRGRAASAGAFAALLPLRITSVLEQNGATYPVTEVHLEEGRSYTEIDFGAGGKLSVWIEGDRVWRQMPGQPPVELRGLERTDELNNTLEVLMKDWRDGFQEVVVLGREVFQGRDVFRVRTAPREGLASTRLVAADDGSVVAEFRLMLIPGAGLQAMEKRYADYRPADGLSWPHAQTLEVAGTRILVTTKLIEPRVKIEPRAFWPPEVQ